MLGEDRSSGGINTTCSHLAPVPPSRATLLGIQL